MPERNLREELQRLLEYQTALETKIQLLEQENDLYAAKIEELRTILQAAKEQITALRQEVDKLSAPPSRYGLIRRLRADGTVDIDTSGGRLNVNVAKNIDVKKLELGQRVRINEAANIVEADTEWEETGTEAKVVAILDNRIVRVSTHLDEVTDVYLAKPLFGEKIREGDTLLVFGNFAYKKLPKSKEVEHLFLAEVPTVTYDQVGGLDKEIKLIRELIEWPYLYNEEFREHGLKPPKGILLFGPPGCGKTLIAKAIANALGQKSGGRSYFMNIKGPELLNKWVGQTEQYIREVFSRAKELANENLPVIVFFDEMDALFPVRGSQVSTDTAGTIVPQFTTEMDGVESFKNIIVIGATNRQDRIDPAVIRPGRFDDKIEIGRPDKGKSYQIFKIYLGLDTVLHPQYFDPVNYEDDYYIPKSKDGKPRRDQNQNIKKYLLAKDRAKVVDYLISMALDRMFDPEKELNQLIEVTFRSGRKQVLYASDFNSGALIEAIVNRAKRLAFGNYIESGMKKEQKGLKLGYLMQALEEEFSSQEKLPSVANPDEWGSIFGIREQIVNVQSLAEERRHKAEEKSKERRVETQSPGHYL